MVPCPAAAFVPVLIAALASACAPRGGFPSLAPRPIERQAEADASPPSLSAPSPADPALAPRLAGLISTARAGQEAFEPALAAASVAAGRAGAAYSESWIEAQVALSRAQAARAATVSALADLDALELSLADQGAGAADLAEVAGALREVQVIVQAQNRQLDALRARLSGS